MKSPEPDPWRLIMRLRSRRVLVEYMEFHKLSGRALGKKAGLGHAIVGHLLSGRRTTCNLATARAIEEALQCPPGFIFVPEVSPVADNRRRSVREDVPA